MQINLLKSFPILISIFLLAGCATTHDIGSSELEAEEENFAATTLAVTAKLRFSDLPVPVGFKLIEDKSFVFQAEGTRVALLKYSGRAQLPDVVEFYREQMLFYNWELLNVVEYDRSVLNFERGGQTCIVTIESRGMRKTITISVAPKAKGNIETQVKK